MFLLISPGPKQPTVKSHYGVIKVYSCLAQQMIFKTEININNSIDEACGVNQYVFFSTVPYANNARNYCNVFQQRSVGNAF